MTDHLPTVLEFHLGTERDFNVLLEPKMTIIFIKNEKKNWKTADEAIKILYMNYSSKYSTNLDPSVL